MATPAPPVATLVSTARRVPRPATYELIERVVGLQLRGASLGELAEGVLPQLLDVFGTQLGALLAYHNDDRSLTLAASSGLSPAGRARLETLHPNAANGWDIPLHGLLNRRAYIIERPHEHPFVPELVAPELAHRVPNLACVPLYRGQFPVGVLLVIAEGHALSETEVMSQVLVYDVLSLALDAGLRQRGEVPQPLDPDAFPALSCEPWQDPRERVHSLEAELAAATRTRGELAAELARLREEHAATARALAEREAEYSQVLEGARAAGVESSATREHEHRQELARLRAEAAASLAAERVTAEGTIKELQSALVDRESTFETTVRKLQAALAERDGLLAERDRQVAELGDERDRTEAVLADAQTTIESLGEEVEASRAERDQIHESHIRELGKTRALYEQRLAEAEGVHGQALGEARARADAAAERAQTADERIATLEHQLSLAREEAVRRREQHEQILGELEDPTADPMLAVRGLREAVTAHESEVARLAGEHAALERRMAHEVQTGERRVAAHHRELQELATAHQRAVAELQAGHQREAEETRDAHRAELARVDAAHHAQMEALHADLTQRQGDERAEHEHALATLRGDFERRLEQLQRAHAEMLGRAAEAARQAESLVSERHGLLAELERLHEERAKVLAAVEDPDAEPATVIRALREQVIALEGENAAARDERGGFEERLHEESRASAERLEATQAAAAAAVAELEAAVATRDATLQERDRTLAALDEAAARARQATAETQEVAQRQRDEIERVRGELVAARNAHAEALARIAAATGRAEALEGELMGVRTELGRLRDEREQVLAAVEDPSAAPAAVIQSLRERVTDLERVRHHAESERAALERRFESAAREHAEQVAGMDRERQARELAQARALEEARGSIMRLEVLAADRAALDERLAAAEHDRAAAERELSEQAARAGALERDLARSEDLLASAREQLEAATALAERAGGPAAWPAPRRRPDAPLPRVSVLEPPPAQASGPREHRVVENNPALREQISFALATGLPQPPPGGTLVANLTALIPGRLDELGAAAAAGAVVLAYAADGSGRSRVFGPMRCYAEPPVPGEIVAAIDRSLGPRRVITLSDDVDALIPTKAALTDAGHSVSMACDPKQALDLLAMFTPDVVLVDLRSAPESAADFLDALPLESGLVQVILVHGDPTGSVLRRVVGRLLRASPLVPNELVEACQNALKGPQTARAKKPVPGRAVRPAPAGKTAPRGSRFMGRGR